MAKPQAQLKEQAIVGLPTDDVKMTVAGNAVTLRWYKQRNTWGSARPDMQDFDERLIAGLAKQNGMTLAEYKAQVAGSVRPEKYEKSSHTTRADDEQSIKKTMKKMRDMINANFEGGKGQLWVTWTYSDNMTDEKQLTQDVKYAVKKLRWWGEARNKELGVMTVIEPQARGAWHVHVLIKDMNDRLLAIPNSVMSTEIWTHGFTKTQRLKGNNVGAYLSAYMTDLPLKDGQQHASSKIVTKTVQGKNGKSKSKRVIKGGRLVFYPKGMHFYRATRNLKQPKVYKKIKKRFGMLLAGLKPDAKPRYTNEYKYSYWYDGREVENTIITEEYNLLDYGASYARVEAPAV